MKNNPRTIFDIENSVLNQSGEGSALEKSKRVMSRAEWILRHRLNERGIEMMHKDTLDIWLVGDKYGLKNLQFNKFKAIEDAHNDKITADGDKEEQMKYRFRQGDFDSLKESLAIVFEKEDRISEIPEVIMLQVEDGEHNTKKLEVPRIINEALDKYLESIYLYRDEDILTHLGENFCCPLFNKFDYNKIDFNEDVLVEYGLVGLESIQRKKQNMLFEKYIMTRNEKYLSDFFSDDVLFEIYEHACIFDEERAYEIAHEFWDETADGGWDIADEDGFFANFRAVVDHEKKRAEWQVEQEALRREGKFADDEYAEEYDSEDEEVYAAAENYVAYRRSISQYAKSVDFDSIKEKMRAAYVESIRKELDAYASEFMQEHTIFEAEKKLLKPILVSISDNPVQRELMRDEGVEIVLEKISTDDINNLLELVAKMKSSASSIMPDKLRSLKSDFYVSVEDKLDARSEITAETEKEIALLDGIFQKTGNIKKVLDVACGNGRISIPLLEKGYEVTGIDANEQFLQSALKKVLEGDIAGAKFKKGDIIDYRSAVESGSQDAVIYTWHSILEAFGPGNFLQTLNSGWLALRPGGVLVFDQPTRENANMEDGWYGNSPDSEHRYLSYIMDEEEIRFILEIAGFDQVEIREWVTKPSEEYPDGMRKFTISARKPEADEKAKADTKLYRGILGQNKWIREERGYDHEA